MIENGGKPQRNRKALPDLFLIVLTTRVLWLALSAAMIRVRALLWANSVELRACGSMLMWIETGWMLVRLWLLTCAPSLSITWCTALHLTLVNLVETIVGV